MIIPTQQLDSKTLADLKELVATCRATDGNAIATYPDLLANFRPKPCSLLHYADNRLVGFASAFFFELDAAELSLLVAPDHRRQGIARQLFHNLLTLIQETHLIKTLAVSTPHAAYDAMFKTHGFFYQNSEYDMHLQRSTPFTINPDASIRLATYDDIEQLCTIDQACFASTHPYSTMRFNTLLQRSEHRIFLILHRGDIIGKAHLAWQHGDQHAHLSDIAVIPAMQRQGFGKELIMHCINDAIMHLSRTTITLSVEANNQHALTLYQHLGFLITNVIDYWHAPFCEQYLASKTPRSVDN